MPGVGTTVLEQLHHVEKVIRMLPVLRRDELAAVDLLCGQKRDLDVGQEGVTGRWCERAGLHRMDGAANDRVDLHLHHKVLALHKELRLTHVSTPGRGRRTVAASRAGTG